MLAVFAVSSLGVYSLILAGWASNSKYPFLGGVRASAQLISYELSMTLSVVPVFLWVNAPGMEATMGLGRVVEFQSGSPASWGGMWFVFLMPVSAFIFLTSLFAETNRQPFDMPESEADLVGGFHTEYGAFKWGLFFVAEYAHMVIGSGVFTLLFLGGWNPLPWVPLARASPSWLGTDDIRILIGILSITIFLGKVLALIFFFMWVRWTVPRFRYDQVMEIGWKKLLPARHRQPPRLRDRHRDYPEMKTLNHECTRMNTNQSTGSIASASIRVHSCHSRLNQSRFHGHHPSRTQTAHLRRAHLRPADHGGLEDDVEASREAEGRRSSIPSSGRRFRPGYRGVPTLVKDPNGREKCVSCQLCEFVCPPKAIRITPGEIPPDAPTGHVEKAPQEFEIDMLRCIYCGMCQEVCPGGGDLPAEPVFDDRLHARGDGQQQGAALRARRHAARPAFQMGQEEGRRGARQRAALMNEVASSE